MSNESNSCVVTASPKESRSATQRRIDEFLNAGPDRRIRLLILNLLRDESEKDDLEERNVDWLKLSLEFVKFAEGYCREKLQTNPNRPWPGRINVEERQSGIIAAIVAAPQVNWPSDVLSTFQELNATLSRLEMPVREFDRSKQTYSQFLDEFTKGLIAFVSQIIEYSPEPPNKRPEFDDDLKRFLKPEALHSEGFDSEDVDAIRHINAKMDGLLNALNDNVPNPEQPGGAL